MVLHQVFHGSKGEQPRLEPVLQQQFLEERPEVKSYAPREMNRIPAGFGIGEHIADNELVEA